MSTSAPLICTLIGPDCAAAKALAEPVFASQQVTVLNEQALNEQALNGQPIGSEAIRLTVSGPEAARPFGKALHGAIAGSGNEVFVRPADAPLPRLACFDMDSTLIQTECINELAERMGIGAQVAAITESAMRGEIDFSESFRRRMALLEGLDEGVLADIASGLPLTPGIEALCAGLKAAGCQIALLSGGFTYFAEHVQGILGIDHVRANRLELIDGKLTGRHLGPIVDGAAKEAALIELAGAHDIPLSATMAVGDGANDLQMLARSGFGVAFHAKPVVAAEADHAISSLGLDCLLPVLGIERP